MSPRAKDGQATATILFVDLVGSSDIASLRGPKEYAAYLERFRDIVTREFKETKRLLKKSSNSGQLLFISDIAGDEGHVIVASNYSGQKQADIQLDIATVIGLALRLKYRWLLDRGNIDLIDDRRKPSEIAIGINTGPVNVFSDKRGRPNRAEGYPINLAKRIEGESRRGRYSGIFIGESTFGAYYDTPGENPIRFRRCETPALKGISDKIHLYELVFANLEEDQNTAILQLPDAWLHDNKEIRAGLRSIKQLFLADQNPWIANVYCNIKWAQIGSAIDERSDKENPRNLRVQFLEVLDVARDLVEIDKDFSAWKIYFGQIAIDYLKYGRIASPIGLFDKDQELIDDVKEILENLTRSETHELDGRLWYARLLIAHGELIQSQFEESDEAREQLTECRKAAKTQAQRIIIWDDKYEDAYFYGGVAQLIGYEQMDQGQRKEAKKRARRFFRKLESFDKNVGLRNWSFEIKQEQFLGPLRDELLKKIGDSGHSTRRAT